MLKQGTKRPTIATLARAAGVSVATVDRVLTGRLPVREVTVARVLEAAETIGFRATTLIQQRLAVGAPPRRFGFLLQKPDEFYRKLGASIEKAAAGRIGARARIEFVVDLSPTTLAENMLRLAEGVDALGIVSVDHPLVSEAVRKLRERGVPTFALLSDLSADGLTGYIGRDNRKEGRTAAWIIAHVARQPGEVGIIVGSHRYLCQETAEISFRAYFREHALNFRLLEPLVNLEDSRLAYAAVQELAAKRKDLVGLYICGGGMNGVVAAAQDRKLRGRVAIVCNELTTKTREGLLDGALSAVISTPVDLLAERTLAAMSTALAKGAEIAQRKDLVPFDLFLPTNI